jgi:hypothetical protein
MISLLVSLVVLLSVESLIDSTERDIHAVYVSVLEIEKGEGKKSGQLRIKVFANDLEDAIYNSSKERIDLLNDDYDQNKDLVNNYFSRHLQINLDGHKVEYHYNSCEVNDISIWFSYEFASITTWSEIRIKADYLMELFPTQSNVVSIDYLGQKKMFRLVKGGEMKIISYTN